MIRRSVVCICLLVACGPLLLYPAWTAAPYADDHFFMALARGTDNPAAYFLSDHFFGGYLFRPVPMLWWWAVEAASLGVPWHYVVNGLWLGLCGATLYALLRVLQLPVATAFALAAVYVVLPANQGTALWLAARFDLMATVFLGAAFAVWIVAIRQPRPWLIVATAMLCLLASLSKETGYLIPVVMAGVIVLLPGSVRALSPDGSARHAVAATLACAAVLGLLLCWRWLLGLPLLPRGPAAPSLLDAASAIASWWTHLPAALLFARAPASQSVPWPVAAMTLAALAAFSVSVFRGHGRMNEALARRRVGMAVAWGALLLLPVAQAPHFAGIELAFASPQGQASGMIVERYYFTAVWAVFVAAACAAPWSLPSRAGTLLLALATTLVMSWGLWRGYLLTSSWPVRTAHGADLARAAAAWAEAHAPDTPGPCRISLTGSESRIFQLTGEAMVKTWTNDPRVLLCAIETERMPLITLTHQAAASWYAPAAEPVGTRGRPVQFAGWLMIPDGMWRLSGAGIVERRAVFDHRSGCWQEPGAAPTRDPRHCVPR